MKGSLTFLFALAIPAIAEAQFSMLLRFKQNGTIVTPTRYFANCTGGGITCADDPAQLATDITVAAGAGGTLQTAYNNSAGASPSILLTAANAPVRLRGPSVAMGNVFIVETNTPTSIMTLTDNGTSSFSSQGALTLTGAATSTWSISVGNLTISSAGSLLFTAQNNIVTIGSQIVPSVHTATVAQAIESGEITTCGVTATTVIFGTAFSAKPVCVCSNASAAADGCRATPNANGQTVVLACVQVANNDTADWYCIGNR